MRQTVDGLPDELRLPLVLRFEEGLTFAAVGSALECSESTAHDRVRHAIDALRARLSKLGFATVAMDLPVQLAGFAPPTVPAGAEAALIELGSGAVPAGVLGWLGTKSTVVLATVLLSLVAVVTNETWHESVPPAVPAAATG